MEYRLPLTHRTVRDLRFDPFMEEGGMWVRAVRVQRGDRVVRTLDPGEWTAGPGVAPVGWDADQQAWRVETIAGASDPHFMLELDEPIPGRGLFSVDALVRLTAGLFMVGALGWLFAAGMRAGWLRLHHRPGVHPGSMAIACGLIVIGSWVWIDRNERVRVSFWVQTSISGEAVLQFEKGMGWDPLRESTAGLQPRVGGREVTLWVPSNASPAVRFIPLRSHVAGGPVEFRVGEVRRGWLNPWGGTSEVRWVDSLSGKTEYRAVIGDDGRTLYRTELRRGEFPAFLIAIEPTPRGSALAGPALRPRTRDWSFPCHAAGVLFGFGLATAAGLGGAGVGSAFARLSTTAMGQRVGGRLDQWACRWRPQERSPVGFFVWNGLIFGVIFLAVTPPYQAPDEPRNFHRAWHVASGHPMPLIDGEEAYGEIPLSLYLFRQVHMQIALNPDARMSGEFWRRMAEVPLHPSAEEWEEVVATGWLTHPPMVDRPRERVDLSDTIYLSPVPYLGSAAGVRLAQWSNSSVLNVHYAGRMGNLLLALALGVLVLRYTPHWNHTLAVVMLAPMSLFLMASNSHDTVTHALGFLLLAMVLRLRCRPEGSLRWWDWWPAALLFPLLVFSKINYILLFPLLLLVPWDRFRNWRGWLGGLAGVVAVLMAALISWVLYYADRPVSEWERPQVDREAQRELVFQYPLYYAEVLYHSFRFNGEQWMKQMIGILGWLDTDPGAAVRLLWVAALALAFLVDGSRWRAAGQRWRWWERVGIAGVVGYSAVAIVTIFFLTWTEPYSLVIQGAQGRYFLPLLPWMVVALALPWVLSRRGEALAGLGMRLAIPAGLALTVWALWVRYWG